MTDEKKQEMFDTWKASDEWAGIETFQQLRESEINAKISRFDMSDKDLCADIQKYLEELNISKIEYIKIDIENADKLVLEDILKNNILAKNLSVECHDSEVLELLISSPYNSFKFVPGPDMNFKNNIKIINKDLKKNY